MIKANELASLEKACLHYRISMQAVINELEKTLKCKSIVIDKARKNEI
jgi:hypothetical protein